MAVTYSISRAGLEIYTTEVVKNPVQNTGTDASDNYILQTGAITQIDYLTEIYSDNFETDYSDISSNATITVPLSYLNYLYKGQRVAFKKGGQTGETVNNWDDMNTVITGFIRDINWTRDKLELKISGMDILLDKEAKFTFKKTKRSKIITEIIKASGLKPKVDVTGLVDDVTDFTNVSSSESSSSSKTTSTSGSEKIDSLAATIIGDETDDYKKLEKIHKWGCDNIRYSGYECSRHNNDPEECLKNKTHLNCGDTSILMRAIYTAANLTCWIIHGNYHFWVIVEINNQKYASDCTGRGYAINDVWSTSKHPNKPFSGSKVTGDICA